MNLRFFIDRPVFSGVISVVIVLMGLIAIKVLPVEQYPDIAPPTVNVFCTYPGANAETVQKAVIVPLEEAINGVEDMIYKTLPHPTRAMLPSTSISSRVPTRTWRR